MTDGRFAEFNYHNDTEPVGTSEHQLQNLSLEYCLAVCRESRNFFLASKYTQST